MLELEYKRSVADALRTMGWNIEEHEDKVRNFIPDLSFGAHGFDGWIEVKFADRVPKTGLRSIKHYTKGQEDWLIDRARAGSGHCYLLLGTGAGHYAWRAESLRKARAGTYIAAQSLCCCRVPAPPEYTLPIAECLNALLLCAAHPKWASEGTRS